MPTNHLDASGLEHLSEALESFEGGILLISHDELLIRCMLASSEHSELLICGDGKIQRQSGLQCFDAYRRLAFREQECRAQAAEDAALRRLQREREAGQARSRRQRASRSAASTREPTPDSQPRRLAQPQMTLANLFSKAKKPKPIRLQL